MKKFIFLLSVLFVALLSFTSCDESKTENNKPPEEGNLNIADYLSFAEDNGNYGYVIRYKENTAGIVFNELEDVVNSTFYNANTKSGVTIIGKIQGKIRVERTYINISDSIYYEYREPVNDNIDDRLSRDYVGYFGTPDAPIVQTDPLYTYKRYISEGGSGSYVAGHGTYSDSVIWIVPEIVNRQIDGKLELSTAIERADKSGRYNLAILFGIE